MYIAAVHARILCHALHGAGHFTSVCRTIEHAAGTVAASRKIVGKEAVVHKVMVRGADRPSKTRLIAAKDAICNYDIVSTLPFAIHLSNAYSTAVAPIAGFRIA